MDKLVQYAAFLKDNCLEEISRSFSNRLKELQLNFLQQYYSLPEEEFDAFTKNNFEEFLTNVINRTIKDNILQSVNLWKEDKVPGIKRDELGLRELILSLSIRKQCLIQFLPEYTNNVRIAADTISEVVELYDFFRENFYQTFLEIQNRQIEREKEFAEAILDTTLEGITGVDKDFKVRVWNKAVSDRTGIKKEDILGKKLFDFFPKNKGTEEEYLRKAHQGEKIHLENLPIKSRPGYYDLDVVPWKGNNGEIIGSLSFSRDVTRLNLMNKELEEKILLLEQTQKELEEKNKFIESIVQTTPDYITVFNLREMRNVFANKRVEEITGHNVNEARKEGYSFIKSILHPDDAENFNSFFKNFGNAKPLVQHIEYRIKKSSNEYSWIFGSYTVLSRDSEGKPLELVGISRDITEQKLTHEKLKDAVNYYLTILDDFPALIWRSDISGNCNYFNKTYLLFTGRSIQEEYGSGWVEGVHPEDIGRCRSIYLENFHKREPFLMEYRLRRSDGEYRWVLDMGKPIYGLNGEFSGFLGACFDIQERRDHEMVMNEKNKELAKTLETLQKAEEKLLEANELLERKIAERTKDLANSKEVLKQALEKTVSLNAELVQRENFLSSIIDQTPVPTYIVNDEGTLIRINKACLDLFEIQNPQTLIGKYNLHENNDLVGQENFDKFKQVFDKGEVVSFSSLFNPGAVDHQYLNLSRYIYLNITAFPIKSQEGKVLNAVVQLEDVTNRLMAEKALKKNEEQLRLITDALPVLISYVDKDLRYRFVNQSYSKWFNKSKQEIEGKKINEVLGDKNFSKVRQLMTRALEGEPVKSEQTLITDQEKEKDVLIQYIPHNQNGSSNGFYALITDISPIKMAQKELINKNRELTRINTDLDNFIYTASHDLKSPIVNLEGLIAALQRTIKDKLEEREANLFNMMGASIGKLKNTISNLSDVTMVAKNFEKNTQLIFIPELVEDVKSDVQEMIKDANAQIIEDYQLKEIDFVKANLKSIFYNLISNAIKYRSPERQPIVKIKTYSLADCHVIEVEDNGLGLSPIQQTKLFSMFKRIHRQGDGSGIGLYIIKRIIENANGEIEVESKENVGSVFKVKIPK